MGRGGRPHSGAFHRLHGRKPHSSQRTEQVAHRTAHEQGVLRSRTGGQRLPRVWPERMCPSLVPGRPRVWRTVGAWGARWTFHGDESTDPGMLVGVMGSGSSFGVLLPRCTFLAKGTREARGPQEERPPQLTAARGRSSKASSLSLLDSQSQVRGHPADPWDCPPPDAARARR